MLYGELPTVKSKGGADINGYLPQPNGKAPFAVGERHAHLTFIKFLFFKKRSSNSMWLCRCDCGKELQVTASNVRNGNTKSCGCSRKLACLKGSALGAAKVRLPKGEAARNEVLSNYRGNAKVRKITWNLQPMEAFALFASNCFYCGSPPTKVFAPPTANGGFTYNGIDRVDPDGIYETGNVVACCNTCNLMKRNYTLDKFLDHVKKISEYVYGGVA